MIDSRDLNGFLFKEWCTVYDAPPFCYEWMPFSTLAPIFNARTSKWWHVFLGWRSLWWDVFVAADRRLISFAPKLCLRTECSLFRNVAALGEKLWQSQTALHFCSIAFKLFAFCSWFNVQCVQEISRLSRNEWTATCSSCSTLFKCRLLVSMLLIQVLPSSSSLLGVNFL